jgi:hypothetical protein
MLDIVIHYSYVWNLSPDKVVDGGKFDVEQLLIYIIKHFWSIGKCMYRCGRNDQNCRRR